MVLFKKKPKLIKNKFVSLERYIVGNIVIQKKDIHNYIRGKGISIFGNDFYYAYVYKNSVLYYILGTSRKFIAGKYPLVLIVLLNQGKYYVTDSNKKIFYVFENTGEKVECVISYEKPVDAMLITEDLLNDVKQKLPGTLKLRWSLQKSDYTTVLVSFFVISFIFYLLMNYKSVDLSERILSSYKPEEVKAEIRNVDLSKFITKIGDEIKDKGFILKIQQDKNNMVFYIQFRKEDYAQEFLKKYGGKYEQNQVIYSVGFIQ